MGYAKAQLEKGFSPIGGKFVCANCFEDYAIKYFIDLNAESMECNYCGEVSEGDCIAADIDDVIEFIIAGVESEYEDPANSIGWCSGEGGWVGAPVYDSDELIEELVEVSSFSEGLIDDIVESLAERQWCQIDPYGDPLSDEFFLDWGHFSKQIKHQSRYVFYKMPKRKNGSNHYSRADNPYDILDCIGSFAERLGLLSTIPANTALIRVRQHDASESFSTYSELGPPPVENAIYSNRMSPSGIPMFYAAFDEKTSIAETSGGSKDSVTIATFKTIKPFQVLDLTSLHPIPSIFDEENRYLRQSTIFMNNFLADISKPVIKDGSEHVEYVPTQVVTEYFRHLFRPKNKKALKGIIYPSSVFAGGKSCVLFFQQENCTQDDVNIDDNKWLSMITASIKTATYSYALLGNEY